MSIFSDTLDGIEKNMYKKDNCIPIHSTFPRFSDYIPGIQKKRYYLISGASGAGKSQITDHIFLFNPYNFIKTEKTDITFKIFYYSLELDKESKMNQWISRRLYDYYGIRTGINVLQSIGKNRLSADICMAVKETREYFEKLEEDHLNIFDGSINPTGIIKELESYARNSGKIIKKPITIKEKLPDGTINEFNTEVFDKYIPNNPNEYVIIVVDHYSLLIEEKGMPIKQTIEKLSKEFVKMRNRYSYIPVGVQQQSAEKENVEHFKSSKLEPSKDGLAESKLTYNDCDIALGIFQPQKHEIKTYRGYNIIEMGDSYRNLNVFKNRYGVSNINIGMYFDGAVNYFCELPKSDSIRGEHYDQIRKKKPQWL